jgi:hypothetical protein
LVWNIAGGNTPIDSLLRFTNASKLSVDTDRFGCIISPRNRRVAFPFTRQLPFLHSAV